MSDYAKLKNAELEALLKERNLPHTGKKAELVKRLQDADAASTEPAAKKDEDEIDWDDEQPAAPAATEPTVPEPAPAPEAVPEAAPKEEEASAPAPATEEETPAPAPPAKDFTAGLAPTALDEEIARRRARAAKFGTDPAGDETLKALERAKKFGETSVAGALDSALPGRRERAPKRKGEDGQQGGQRKKAAPAPAEKKKQQPEARKNTGAGGWMTDADRAAAEARKAKFAVAK